jgi:hypothetical protein
VSCQQARIGLCLQNNQSDRNIVQIFSADWSTVDAIVMTIPTYRPQPADETNMNLPSGLAKSRKLLLLKWYYPDR